MSIPTFPWADIGICEGLRPVDRCFTIRHEYGGGYIATRARGTKILKAFECVWVHGTNSEWLHMIEFWRSVGSHEKFYWQVPWAEEPIYLMRFRKDSLEQEYQGPPVWGWSCIFDEAT